jgi:hypothetical protein
MQILPRGEDIVTQNGKSLADAFTKNSKPLVLSKKPIKENKPTISEGKGKKAVP